jgi:hypothetical protein
MAGGAGIDWVGIGQVVAATGGVLLGAGGGLAGMLAKRKAASSDEVQQLRDENRKQRQEIHDERTVRRREIRELRQEYDQRFDDLTADLVECNQDRARLRRELAKYGNGGAR